MAKGTQTPRRCQARRSRIENVTHTPEGIAYDSSEICTAPDCPWVEAEKRKTGRKKWTTQGAAYVLYYHGCFPIQGSIDEVVAEGRKRVDIGVALQKRFCENL